MSAWQRSLRTIADGFAVACVLGIALDLVTAHVAVEYFTVHHPKVVDSKSPIAMALLWGIGAAWWFGAIAGALLALLNRRRAQPLEPNRIRRWMIVSALVLWASMMLILASVYCLIGLIPEDKRGPSFDYDRRLMAVAITHMTEYVLGAVAFVSVGLKVWRSKS